MSTSTGPEPFDPNRRARLKAALALGVGAIGIAGALVLDSAMVSSAPSVWSGEAFGRALAQYRRYAWFDTLENALTSQSASTRRDALAARFPNVATTAQPYPRGFYLAVSIAEPDLTGADGLLTHVDKKGDAWERPAIARFYRDNQIIAETRAGYRVHGGTGRTAENPDFRLYFRKAYGASAPIGTAVWPAAPERLDRLVAKSGVINGVRNKLALEVSRRLGVLTPEARFAAIRINNDEIRSGLLLEHLSADWIDSRFGHRDFVFRRLKGGGRRGRGTLYVAMEARVNQLPDLRFHDVEHLIDMRELAAQYLATLLTRTEDPFQGAMILDERTPGAKWRYIAWDMEGAFPKAPPDDYARYLGYPPGQTPILRAVLWRKLAGDPEFADLIRTMASDALERLDDDWIKSVQNAIQGQLSQLPELDRTVSSDELARCVALLKHYRDTMRSDLGRIFGE